MQNEKHFAHETLNSTFGYFGVKQAIADFEYSLLRQLHMTQAVIYIFIPNGSCCQMTE
jgi:hypothetical protein